MIYLDNAATTKPCNEAVKAASDCMRESFGNPSSLHKMGIKSEKILTAVKKELLLRLNKEGEIFFTSGATESNNLAIFGTVNALKRRGNRIVTTGIEHPSVSEPMKRLREQALGRVQGFCKVPLYGDTISLSAHKIHGIKGVGALYKSKKTRLLPIVYGGGQQQGLRSGTEPVELISAFGAAVRAYPKDLSRFSELNGYLKDILNSFQGIEINSFNSVDNILNFSVEGVRSEIMLHFLEEKEIYVSSGSACSRGKVSPVLSALGINARRADSAIRVSFCPQNSAKELDLLAQALDEGIKRFRR